MFTLVAINNSKWKTFSAREGSVCRNGRLRTFRHVDPCIHLIKNACPEEFCRGVRIPEQGSACSGMRGQDKTEFAVSRDDRLSLQCQCDLPGISKSGLYYLPKGESDENLEIMKKMDKHHHDHPTYGVLQMQDYLFALGFIVNHKRVRRLMRKARIIAQYPKRNLSKLGLAGYIYPYLLRNLDIDHPNQVWEIDITYIPMDKGFMYLTAIIDVYSRFIVGWGLHNSLHGENALEVLEAAIQEHGVPEIV